MFIKQALLPKISPDLPIRGIKRALRTANSSVHTLSVHTLSVHTLSVHTSSVHTLSVHTSSVYTRPHFLGGVGARRLRFLCVCLSRDRIASNWRRSGRVCRVARERAARAVQGGRGRGACGAEQPSGRQAEARRVSLIVMVRAGGTLDTPLVPQNSR